MKCRCCDTVLTDFEATRKTLRGEYLDMCSGCFEPIKSEILVIEREDLRYNDSLEPDEYTLEPEAD
jgi:hypothetical protein